NLASLAVVVAVALLVGFRSGASVAAWLAVAALLALVTLALTWVPVIARLSAGSVEGAGGFSYPLILLPFRSSAFVPTAAMARRDRDLGRARLAGRHPRRRAGRRGDALPPPARLRRLRRAAARRSRGRAGTAWPRDRRRSRPGCRRPRRRGGTARRSRSGCGC